MEELKSYLRSLDGEAAREAFAMRCGCALGHLRNVTYGLRLLDAAKCVAVERESGFAVRRWHLRPHEWHQIWPELVGADGAPSFENELAEKAAA